MLNVNTYLKILYKYCVIKQSYYKLFGGCPFLIRWLMKHGESLTNTLD